MSRAGGPRRSGDDLAYGELPQRWDRDRFERVGGGPPRDYQENYRYYERDTPRRQEIAVADRIDERGPRGYYEERDRYVERDTFSPGGRRRRTDKELFGDVDPREMAEMAMTPYRRKSVTREELDIDQRSPPSRPGLIRRQSSLDTFDRRPIPRYEREEYRIPVYTPVPLPYPRESRGRDYYAPEDYREVEITREKSVHRTGGRAKSVKSSKSHKSRSRASSSSSSSTETIEASKSVHRSNRGTRRAGTQSVHGSFHESSHGGGAPSVHGSFHESMHDDRQSISESIELTEKRFKKGKTRMPKRLVRREAIQDLGYPFVEEEDFYVLTIALEKEQIDEVIRITGTYNNGGKSYATPRNHIQSNEVAEKKTVYKFDEQVDEAPEVPQGEREEVWRTEWINPPTVVGRRRGASRSDNRSRHSSPNSSTTRARSQRPSRSGGEFFEERKTVFEEGGRPPPPPMAPLAPPPQPSFYEERKTVVEESGSFSPSHARSPSQHGTMVLQDREYRSDRDIQAEISRLEAERRALRLERQAQERRDLAVRTRERPEEEYQLVEYRDRPAREEVLTLYDERERERSPQRNVLRVEKDRKGRMALVRSSH